MVEDIDIHGLENFILFCALLKILRQGISSFINLVLTIINMEVITRTFLDVANMRWAQTLYIHKWLEVIVVGEYEHLELRFF